MVVRSEYRDAELSSSSKTSDGFGGGGGLEVLDGLVGLMVFDGLVGVDGLVVFDGLVGVNELVVFDGLVEVDDDGGKGGKGGGGGGGYTQVHALGGPSVPPPERVHEANQAVAP